MKKMLLNFKDRMFRLSEDESLSPLSILVIILLDIFLLTVLFQGIAAQSRLLTTPDQYIPYICQEIIIDQQWTENNRLDKLSDIVIGYHRATDNEAGKPGKMAPICKELVEAIDTVKIDPVITKLFEERNRLITLRAEIKNNLSDVGSLSEVRTNPKYIALSDQISAVNQRINANPKTIILWQVIGQSVTKQEIVIRSLRSYRYFFPLYEVLWQFLFLLPLLALFYLWYKKSAAKNRLQSLISTHLLIVVSIPILLKIIKLVLDVLPRQIVEKFIDLLDSLKLIALWYYLVIGIAIGIAILLIYVLQKHLFNRGKIIEKRIRNCNCIGCGKKLPAHDPHCFSCGADQYQVCPQCGRLTYVNSQYCRECGQKIDQKYH